MLRDLGIIISYSLDGPPELNDELRGGGRKIVENWRRMKANGTDAGTICLIQPSNWDRMDEVLKFFHEEGIHNVRFNLMVPDGRGKEVDTASTEKLFNAKKTVLDYMLETKGQSVVDATLYNAMKRFVKGNGAPSSFEYHGCESLYCQAGRTLYSINPDGKFYACDRIAENPLWAMGNVNQPFTPPEKEFAAKKRRAFHHKDDWWARCEGCDAKKICEFSCSAYYVDQVDTRDIECEYTKMMWDYFLQRRNDIVIFMKRGVSTVFIDEKKPLEDQPEDTWVIRDVAADAAYNNLSLVETLAANQRYQLFERGGQFYIYLFKRDKIFEVDEIVAEIARFNGVLAPQFIPLALGKKFPKGKLKTALEGIAKNIPEVLSPMDVQGQKLAQEHAGHLLNEDSLWHRLFSREQVAAP
ncbi:MAG: SPASM domain-containing protein [Deltaproteobacteria bacterium]|nr:SPASM domain-containing protein [Deltaproteobacteria bacterium]